MKLTSRQTLCEGWCYWSGNDCSGICSRYVKPRLKWETKGAKRFTLLIGLNSSGLSLTSPRFETFQPTPGAMFLITKSQGTFSVKWACLLPPTLP